MKYEPAEGAARPGRKRGWTDDQLREAVRMASSVYGVFRHMGLKVGGGQHMLIKQRIKELGLDTCHFTGQRWNRSNVSRTLVPNQLLPLEQILVKDSPHVAGRSLKRRLIAAGLLQDRCASCDLVPEWQGKPLVMRLDHKNGVRNDHRLENLRFLCPNCDSQMPTFAGRNKGRADPVK
jgi:hypothetical protein